jgi:hypothetical protein
VPRHREPKPETAFYSRRASSFHRCTPPDAFARDHDDGRSPGSRVFALRRLPGFPSGVMARGSPLTVAGAAMVLALGRTMFPFDPRREPSAARLHSLEVGINPNSWVRAALALVPGLYVGDDPIAGTVRASRALQRVVGILMVDGGAKAAASPGVRRIRVSDGSK